MHNSDNIPEFALPSTLHFEQVYCMSLAPYCIYKLKGYKKTTSFRKPQCLKVVVDHVVFVDKPDRFLLPYYPN